MEFISRFPLDKMKATCGAVEAAKTGASPIVVCVVYSAIFYPHDWVI